MVDSTEPSTDLAEQLDTVGLAKDAPASPALDLAPEYENDDGDEIAPEQPPADGGAIPSPTLSEHQPPPFEFPSVEDAYAARLEREQPSGLVVAGASGSPQFESVSLDENGRSAHGWGLADTPDIDKGALPEPVPEAEEEPEPEPEREQVDEPEEKDTPPTPPLSDSASTAPPTEGATSKVALPESGTPVEVAVAGEDDKVGELPTSPTQAATSPVLSPSKRRPSGTPSVFQLNVSMTRQRDLPPKDKEQEKKHLRELEAMLTASKEAEKRRKAGLEAAAAARAATLAAALPTWESTILPNWRAVLHDDATGKSLRKLWWDGTMPVRWRGRMWGLCIGNGLAVGKTAYASALARAQKGIDDGQYPLGEKEKMEHDVEDTLPDLKLFQKDGGVMHEDLMGVLLAYSVHAGGQPRYPEGLSYLAALLLVNMPPADAFISLLNLVDKSFLKSFYGGVEDEIDAYYRIFDTLLADTMPKVYANFLQEVVRPSLYLKPWLITAFVRFLPLDLATRVFDVFLLEGDSLLFRIALVILQILEPRLFNPVQSELDAVFKGEDRGAVLVVKRDKGTDEDVRVEEVYNEMGCTEEAVFRLLREMDWKEETWDRLVARELPEAD
ncbi:TBC domain protein, Rab GTPase activator [Pseudohyphozyma bogoriensis]|nr:TBC domain protein, Rab GTPase activator [Pseudohyphozyma bogoriensis]